MPTVGFTKTTLIWGFAKPRSVKGENMQRGRPRLAGSMELFTQVP